MEKLYKSAVAYGTTLGGLVGSNEPFYYQWTDYEFSDQLERWRGY